MNNKAAGTKFEKEFADMLAKQWFWVHLFQDNKNGQPCDIVAAKRQRTYLIDCKDCQGNYFQLSRMEENQYNAMHLFRLTGNRDGYLAIRFSSGKIYLLRYWAINVFLECGIKRLSEQDCAKYGKHLSVWLEEEERCGANIYDGVHRGEGSPGGLRKHLLAKQDSRGEQNADRDWK